MDLSKYDFGCQKAFHNGLQHARRLGHLALDVEHVAYFLLQSFDPLENPVDRKKLTATLEAHLKKLQKIIPAPAKVEFGDRLDKALDHVESLVSERSITMADLWQGLERESTVIKNFTLTSKEVSKDLDVAEKEKKPKERRKQSKENDLFRNYTIDLTARAERGEFDPVIGRDIEVRRLQEILGRKKKNNPMLLGEPGVGKTAVIEGLAIKIAKKEVPESLQGKRVLSLDIGSLLAGAKFRGEFEERVKNLVQAIESQKGQIILFIDEIHMIVGAGNHEGGVDVANLLKPALARGNIHCVGATTLAEYRRYFERDAALERRFQILHVEEPSIESSMAILRGLKSRYESFHGVTIEDSAIVAAVELSTRYITLRRLPDKAIDLLDEAASRMRLKIASTPHSMEDLKAKIDQIELEKKSFEWNEASASKIQELTKRMRELRMDYDELNQIWKDHQNLNAEHADLVQKRGHFVELFEQAKQQQDFDFAAKIQLEEIPSVDQAIAKTAQQLERMEKSHPYLSRTVGPYQISEIISAWTGIPVTKLLETESQKLLALETRLAETVFGQSKALEGVARAVRRSRVGVRDSKRPVGTFLFAGPTGVGKTATAKALAKEIFNDETKMIRIDMSEFTQEHQVARLIGAPPGYVGFADGGQLTEAVKHQPFSVVLFDEIEKAHPRIFDTLLQLIDDGRLTDSKGVTVDFRNTMIILTSNFAIYDDQNLGQPTWDDSMLRERLIACGLRPEFVNRIDHVICFERLSRTEVEQMVDREVSLINERLKSKNLQITLGENLKNFIAREGENPQFGGRALKRAFEHSVLDALAEQILTLGDDFTGSWTVESSLEGHDFSWTKNPVQKLKRTS